MTDRPVGPEPGAVESAPGDAETRCGRSGPPSAGTDPSGSAGAGRLGPDGTAGEDRLERWMERYGVELERHLTGMLGRPDDAEDVLQEVWITAHRSPPGDGDGANVRAWLYRVATNAALDRLGRRRRREDALDGREGRVLPEGSPPPDAWMDRLGERGRRRVREAVSRLPYKQRRAVRLRWLEGEPYEKIALELSSSRAGARANVYQGMKKLHRELQDLWNREAAP